MEDIRQGFKHLVGVPHKEPLMETQMSKYVKCLVLILQALPMAVNKGETHPIASIGILTKEHGQEEHPSNAAQQPHACPCTSSSDSRHETL